MHENKYINVFSGHNLYIDTLYRPLYVLQNFGLENCQVPKISLRVFEIT